MLQSDRAVWVFFSEETNQKTFISSAAPALAAMAGKLPQAQE
jgi:hypothetical protein